jgi:thioredoxin 1
MTTPYADLPLTRAETDAFPGAVVLDFGTNWCGRCRAAEPHIRAVLSRRPEIRHIRVEDGSGRRLGRSFGVKLWPTLIVLDHGREVARVVRPPDAAAVESALAKLAPAPPSGPGTVSD